MRLVIAFEWEEVGTVRLTPEGREGLARAFNARRLPESVP